MDEILEYPPPKPPDESGRLEKLEALGLADERPVEPATRLMELAALATGASYGWLSVLDENTRWFKATHGLEASSTAREESLCAYTIAAGEMLVVEDLGNHPFFGQRDWGIDASTPVRSYCGIPVYAVSRDSAVGTVAIADETPRTFDEQHRQMLRLIRNDVQARLGMYAVHAALGEQAGRVERLVEEHQEMFHRIRGQLIDVAGAINSDAGFVERLSDRTEIREAARDIVASAEFIDDVLEMADGFISYTGGRLQLLGSTLEELRDQLEA